MISFFCGSEAELESRFSELLPDGRSAMCFFSVMVFFLFMILNTEQFAPNILLVVVVAMCLIVYVLWMCPSCQKHREAAVDNRLRGHTEQLVHVPPFATRAQLSDVRIQLALLDRDFDYRDYDALRALDDDITQRAPTMIEEDINVIPVHGNRTHDIVVDCHDS